MFSARVCPVSLFARWFCDSWLFLSRLLNISEALSGKHGCYGRCTLPLCIWYDTFHDRTRRQRQQHDTLLDKSSSFAQR